MGQSTNGQICYGILFPEDYEFPWEDYNWEEWWLRKICGYKNPFQLYGENGEQLPGMEKKKNIWYESKRKFQKQHPFPVEIVNCCSGEVPIYIIAVKGSDFSAWRGDPTSFFPQTLRVTNDERNKLIHFCEEHLQPRNDCQEYPKTVPQWYLSSYWG